MKTNKHYTIAIDPSINFCGYAIFNKKKKLVKHGLLRPPSEYTAKDKKSYLKKSKYMYLTIKKMKDTLNASVVLEVPQYWGVAGFMSRESGALFKLTFLCGMLYGLGKVHTVNPTEWKGQIPKHVVGNRLQRVYKDINFETLDHNVGDAIGIGRYHLFGTV